MFLQREKKMWMSLVTKLAVKNLMHPFQPFMLGQKIYPIRVAIRNENSINFLWRK